MSPVAASIVIRLAQARDVAAMREIEVAAGQEFNAIGMTQVAQDEPLPAAELLAYQRDGRAWVAVASHDGLGTAILGDAGSAPVAGLVAYLIVDRVDGNAHVEQVSVDPAYRGRGIGAALIEQAACWGREWGASALTLTSFAQVRWNAPYYERLGFRPLTDAQLTPGLRHIRADEAAHGLDRWPRLAMRKEL